MAEVRSCSSCRGSTFAQTPALVRRTEPEHVTRHFTYVRDQHLSVPRHDSRLVAWRTIPAL